MNIIEKMKGKRVIFILVTCLMAVLSVFIVIRSNRHTEVFSNKTQIMYKKTTDPREFLDLFSKEFILRNPEYIDVVGKSGESEININNYRFYKYSEKFQSETYGIYKRYLADMESLNYSGINEEDRLSIEMVRNYLQDYIEGEKYSYFNYLINPADGIQCKLTRDMVDNFEIKQMQDARDYINVVSMYDDILDKAMKQMKDGEEKGVVLPKYILDRIVTDIKVFISSQPSDNILYISFVEKVLKLKDINTEDKQKMFKSLEGSIKNTVYPAFKKLVNYIEKTSNKYGENAERTNTEGWNEYYRYLLKHYTTMDIDPGKLHDMALNRVEELKRECNILANEFIAERLHINHQIEFSNMHDLFIAGKINDIWGEDIIAEYKSSIENSKKVINQLFYNVPDKEISVEWVDYEMRRTLWDDYIPPAIDGSSQAKLMIPTLDFNEKRIILRSLYNQVYPGYYMQQLIQQGQGNAPLFRKAYSFEGYSKGWGYYSEHLAFENGLYKEKNEKLSYLQSQLYQAALAVIDTGVNYKGWTASRAANYIVSNTGLNFPMDIDICFSSPGKLSANYVCGIRMIEIREKARVELGDKFNIKDFHDVVLREGSIPLGFLEEQVQKYIVSKK